ncbi:DUF1093 domain-containing protein [Bacillus sp. JJ1127]|uniref:DUF1093 domain-containing protein n=1 Tax=Bacillus sp. JJ1127 TaxID=3122952 RepID=UPI002FFF9F41
MFYAFLSKYVKWKRYEYKVTAYDEKGNTATIKFTANKNLKFNIFSRVYVFDETDSAGYKGISFYRLKGSMYNLCMLPLFVEK